MIFEPRLAKIWMMVRKGGVSLFWSSFLRATGTIDENGIKLIPLIDVEDEFSRGF